jgi:hypothetical protein
MTTDESPYPRPGPEDRPGPPADFRPVVATFDWRRDEHAHVVRTLARDLGSRGPWRWLGWVIAGITPLVLLVAGLSIAAGDSPVLMLALWAVLVGLFVGRVALQGWLASVYVGRHDPSVRAPITHAYEADGLHLSGANLSVRLAWDGVPRVRETERALLVHYGERHAYWTPLRAFDGDELARLRQVLRERLGDRAELRA